MQNRLFIKIFAITLGLVCLYHISFTYKVKQIEKKAYEYSQGDYKIEQDSLKAWENKEIYNLGFAKYTYSDCKERQINLGLDLKGGMNVILEVSIRDIIKALSNYSQDPIFNASLQAADKKMKNSQEDYLDVFYRSYSQINSLPSVCVCQFKTDIITKNHAFSKLFCLI